MRAQPKPDSSFASNHLTRYDLKGGEHLLSTFNKSPTENAAQPATGPDSKPGQPDTDDEPQSDSDDVLSTMSSNAIEELDVKSEVASKDQASASETDIEIPSIENDFNFDDDDFMGIQPMSHSKGKLDEPGTDDEPVSSSGFESDESAEIKTKKTLQEKLDAEKLKDKVKKAPRRTYSEIKSDNESENEIFSSWRDNSKRTKRTHGYSRTKSGSTFPGSSARSAVATPDKLSQQSKKKKNDSPKKPTFPAFRMPTQVDITRPPNPRSGDTKGSTDLTAPQASNSNSSLGTVFSNDPQSMSLDDTSGSSLSSAPSSPGSPAPRQSLCPMCKKEVDPELLMLFEAQPKQRIREQQQFCASHQQNTAEKEWEASGYPDINWDTFDERVQKHYTDLEKLLVPDCTSYYRNILDTTLKSGQAKNFRLTLTGKGIETISCGYYGTKGAARMLQAIVDRFSLKLRRLASSDHIVKAAGVAGYAQSVLVPELAVRLVMEDMDVSDDAARQILRESIQLGQRLNPAADDFVPIPVDSEN
ncbi:hypothetical protein N7448_003142 [Penicillium atrosanguineum]|uniref:Restriction of telomere capping protein 4 n=1 Tax=Penicillium atrosanguineum TaxID=1132637 RepID=A0A9W9H6W0_9EURO|nr:uncharacterized protein N7443_002118 [Penicillium atrosanguineum]KAJ5122013.1 hypothetical protein N7526_008950 [Penicillium atrosanguineum]KAJ5139734.1 hypothetical protein N7448_003142 [Penicillium atrosanguineum]KAJ5309657.1 hypothetical protein N7443_002118 [Penicillium atrosanguineum]KAJ5315179.1 hypothetical protein N7476_005486 [Penicillium atrosanguineum]